MAGLKLLSVTSTNGYTYLSGDVLLNKNRVMGFYTLDGDYYLYYMIHTLTDAVIYDKLLVNEDFSDIEDLFEDYTSDYVSYEVRTDVNDALSDLYTRIINAADIMYGLYIDDGTDGLIYIREGGKVEKLRVRFSGAPLGADQFRITATGDGSTTSALTMQTSSPTTLTLTNNARFYTNAAGIEGESKTFTTTGALDTIYIKLSTETDILTVGDVSLVTKLGQRGSSDFFVAQTNSPTLTGSVTAFENLTHIYAEDEAYLSGDVSGMTSLEELVIGANVSISSSLNALSSLAYLKVNATSSSSLSISLTNLTSLTYVDVGANVTVSGSVTLLTSLTHLVVDGTTDISGSVANLTSLTNLTVGSGNYLEGSITDLDSLTNLDVEANNELSGTTTGLTPCTYVSLGGGNSLTYTTYTWPALMTGFIINRDEAPAFSLADVTQAIIDADDTTWVSGSELDLSDHAGMADTDQGGIWGDFSGDTADPSDLAVAYTLMALENGGEVN